MKSRIKGLCLAALLTVPSMGAVQAGTTTADFLKWERKAQESYFNNSITMIGVIAGRNKPDIAKCLDEWYFKTNVSQRERNTEFLETMKQYADYHPSAVVLGLVEQSCGELK